MLNVVNLTKNESLKLSRRLSTWIMVGLLLVITIIAGIIIKVDTQPKADNNWKSNLTATNQNLEKAIARGGAPYATIQSWKNDIEINNYRLEHNIPPIERNSLWGFASGASSLISLIALFAIILGGGIVASEFSEGTIKLLLIRPSKRWKILLSKYIAVLVYILMMLVILFIFSFLLGGLLFSFDGASSPYLKNVDGNIVKVNMIAHTLGVYGIKCIDLIMMVTLAFMISTVFRSSALAIGLGVFLFFIGNNLVFILSKYSWVKYILFANTNLDQYISGTPMIKGMTLSFSITMLIIYYFIFNLISFLGFSKRDVAA